jgi:putative transposase
MPRQARIVIPDHPHHVTHRGNRKMPVFFQEDDYAFYKFCIMDEAAQKGLKIWAYCLMSNHVHFIAVPSSLDSLSLTFREAHRRYTSAINRREGWTGHLWEGRFYSKPMTESHALMAARYIENNPVDAGICARAEDYGWSSAQFHCGLRSVDQLLDVENPLPTMVPHWAEYLAEGMADKKLREDQAKLIGFS